MTNSNFTDSPESNKPQFDLSPHTQTIENSLSVLNGYMRHISNASQAIAESMFAPLPDDRARRLSDNAAQNGVCDILGLDDGELFNVLTWTVQS